MIMIDRAYEMPCLPDALRFLLELLPRWPIGLNFIVGHYRFISLPLIVGVIEVIIVRVAQADSYGHLSALGF